MPGRLPGGNQAGTIIFPGVPKHFDVEGAAKFLRNSPVYVTKYAKLIQKRYPEAFKKAGYRFDGNNLQLQTGKTASGAGRFAQRWPIYETVTAYKPEEVKQTASAGGWKPQKPKPSAPAASGRQPAGSGGGSGGVDMTTLAGDSPVIDLSGLDKLNPMVGKYLDPNLAKGGAKLLDMGAADAMAGLQFDPQIQDLRVAQAQAPRDTAQQRRDVGGWYQQVLDSLRTAAGRDTAIQAAGVDSVGEATRAIVSSLGGEANQGSALVGASGQDAVGTLTALGAAQDQYNADLAPLLQSEKAGALSRVEAAGSARLHDLAVKLAQAKGQRGQAEAQGQLQIQQANNGILDSRNKTLIDILGANNALGQQRYSNAFGQETARISAGVSGAKIISDILDAAKPASGASRTYTYAKAPSATKGDWLAQLDQVAQRYAKDPAKAFVAMRNVTNGYGWSVKNPAVMAGLRQIATKYGINF